MKEEIDALITKAHRSFEVAKQLFESKNFDFAASRAYYALFYISEALLLKKQKKFSKHVGVMNGIYHEYIKTSELPTSFHETLHKAYKAREKADYLSSLEITQEEAQKLLDDIEVQMQKGIKILENL